ncbi:hypothetical protein ACWEOE_07615 [Amycolatopsis sp. NPDC004368]
MIDNLPPRRELPPEVRDRIRYRVNVGLVAEKKSRRPMWLAAAAVVVLAAGAVFATGVLRDGDGDRNHAPLAPAAPTTASPGELQDAVDRCWNAAKTRGYRLALPRDWQLKIIFKHKDTLFLAAMIGDKPLFCETTLTSVTVSDPAAKPVPVPRTQSTVLLRTVDGVVAGMADPAWRQVAASTPDATILPDGPVQAAEVSETSHQFVVFTNAGADVPIALGPGPGLVNNASLVTVLPTLITAVDRPAPAQRTSDAGKFLGECLTGSRQPVPDLDAWVAGAHLSWNQRELVVARLGRQVITCSARPYPGKAGLVYYAVNPNQQELTPGEATWPLTPVLGPGKETGEPERLALVAGVPENVTRVSVTFPGGRQQDAVVGHGTFAIWHTDADESSVVDGRTTAKAYDATGKVVIEASLKLI